MKQLTSAEIRSMFLAFFQEKNHQREPSASLVPKEDPTLLWINSGVATLKKYFDGSAVPDNPRLVNAQKAIRTNDIENVGYTARHHTFFEMLGNFSIGDYFKKEAIQWAWEFLTSDEWIGLDPERLSVTVHPEDDEAYDLWLNEMKLPAYRIIRLEENFWDIGEGPSGPNTEIFYDRGKEYGDNPNEPELYPGGENARYLEIWNLVFSQYNHNPDDTYTPLPNKNIDTGLGLERLTSIIQETRTNFETDLFRPIIQETEKLTNIPYGKTEEADIAYKVIADHIRTVSFAIGDHALPSNEGRGYVLRRLLRRAVRFGKQIGIEKPFMYKLISTVGTIMDDYYPEILKQTDYIENIVKIEEERFHETLHDGLAILNDVIEKEKANNRSVFPGKEVFKLYDTFGFPKELTEEYVAEEGFTIDEAGFKEEMNKQRERARNAREKVNSMQVQDEAFNHLNVESTFIGYEQLEVETTIEAIIKDNEIVDEATEGEEVFVLLKQTPFYAESGGQVADIGIIYNDDLKVEVTDVQKSPKSENIHQVNIITGPISVGTKVTAIVESSIRKGTIKNHTATHLLHQALRDVLGDHVGQAGSLVTFDKLRFDFSHYGSVTEEELSNIETIVNEKIWAALPVTIESKPIDEAKNMGAMALFGEKYGDVVRVVQIGSYSIELCGGCHAHNTDELGLFSITSESGIGAGTRRIEAVTSKYAYQLLNDKVGLLTKAAHLLKTGNNDVPERLEGLFEEMKQLEKENESLRGKLSHIEASSLSEEVEKVEDVQLLAKEVNASNMNDLRNMLDNLKDTIGSGVIILAAENKGKVLLTSGVTKDLIKRNLHAGNLIKLAAKACGGGGGGRPDMAQAGGKNPENISQALQIAKEYIKDNLK